MSAFTPEKLAYMQAHINDSRVTAIHWLYSVPIVAATISTGLRLWAKHAGRNGITLDDYLIVCATVCLLRPSILIPTLIFWDRSASSASAQVDWDSVLIRHSLQMLPHVLTSVGPPHGMGRHVIAVAPEDLIMVRKVYDMWISSTCTL